MLQAVEAVIKERRIQPVEPISMEENARFLLDTMHSSGSCWMTSGSVFLQEPPSNKLKFSF